MAARPDGGYCTVYTGPVARPSGEFALLAKILELHAETGRRALCPSIPACTTATTRSSPRSPSPSAEAAQSSRNAAPGWTE